MSSLVVKSSELGAECQQFIIGVFDSKLFVASDLLPTNDHPGLLRVLSRTFCGADEFKVVAAIPFSVSSGCSKQGGSCDFYTGSKAVYAMGSSKQFIWVFAYGVYAAEIDALQSMFRISTSNGEYTRFKLDNFDSGEHLGWEVCTVCRGSELNIVSEEDNEIKLVLCDSVLTGQMTYDDQQTYSCTENLHRIELVVNMVTNSFDMVCREHSIPGGLQALERDIQLMNSQLTQWCWLEMDSFLFYDIQTKESGVFKPRDADSELLNKFSSDQVQLMRQSGASQFHGLKLFINPHSELDHKFLIYDVHFCFETKTFGLTENESKATPKNIPVLEKRVLQRSRAYMEEGILYKFYGNHCLTTFLRMPRLAEAAFVGLQLRFPSNEEDQLHGLEVLSNGVGLEQLNAELNTDVIWF